MVVVVHVIMEIFVIKVVKDPQYKMKKPLVLTILLLECISTKNFVSLNRL